MENPFSSKPGVMELFAAGGMVLACLSLLLMGSHAGVAASLKAHAQAVDPSPPSEAVKLIFIHHSCGDNWLDTGNGNLGDQLGANNYYVSDTYYGWGPDGIGDNTDIGHWWTWFRGPNSSTYTQALYNTTNQHASYTRPMADPGGENEVIMFKSCYPNSNLLGNPDDPPTTDPNPLRGQGCWSEHHTVANAKGIYNDILEYFETRQDKLFVAITAPPVRSGTYADNARAFNTWLAEDWLDGYLYNNVAVFDFYNVLTSNGGNWYTNDFDWETGNHHRYRNSAIEYIADQGGNTAAYPDDGSDNHPSAAGNQKATGEFVSLLNIFYNRWKSSQNTTTYYVRPDGGSHDECTGLVDAPYSGSGTGQPCAWDHPFRALPPDGTPRIAGGDTLIIGAGSYRMGLSAPGADNCSEYWPWGCHMPPIPSGPDPAHPTCILGAGWDTGCASPPELWGTERPWFVVNLTDSSNVEIACLEITDHSGCVEFHSGGLACERDSYPFGPWAATGLYAEDSANVHLRDLNIHGLADAGIRAGRLTDWTVEDVRIAGNGWVGWDGDIDGNDSNSGTLLFRRWTVEWNGCGETYPGGEPTGCWGQTAGGYGDGVGTGATGGHWIIEDSAFLHNTSDGLDLLYVREVGSSIEIRRTIAEGNAGNQIKASGPTLVENSILVGNCGFFDGQPFTYNVDNCRALGTALPLFLRPGNQATVINNTLTSEGDCLVTAECDGTCDGSELVLVRNNIFQGHPDFLQPYENTCLTWTDGLPHDPFDIDYSVINDAKHDPCPGPHDICGVSPGLVNPSIDDFDAHLLPDSPAIDAGTNEGAPEVDFDGNPRPLDGDSDEIAVADIGADEFTLVGDLDGDGDVDIVDIMLVASRWHTAEGDPDYVAAYDLDGNGVIDIVDIMLVAIHWGENCTTPTTTPTATPTPTTTATPTTAFFPDWAFEARLAGASFELEMSNAEIDARLQQAADEGVSVLLADAPTGWSYTAWVDGAEFNQVLALMRDRVFPRAHA
ncbi:MAG: hypothetical protein H8D78_06140, partial [Chloroflexi bacterium]|nr:hypothetical protein [Chloroflexota bacterium]